MLLCFPPRYTEDIFFGMAEDRNFEVASYREVEPGEKLMVDEFERFFSGHDTLFDLTPRTLDNRRGNEP